MGDLPWSQLLRESVVGTVVVVTLYVVLRFFLAFYKEFKKNGVVTPEEVRIIIRAEIAMFLVEVQKIIMDEIRALHKERQ